MESEDLSAARGLAFTQEELDELARARTMPIVCDEDCPEVTLEQALKFRRVNPHRPDNRK